VMMLERVPRGREGVFTAKFNATIELPQIASLIVAGALAEAFDSYRVVYAVALVALATGAFFFVTAAPRAPLHTERCSPLSLDASALDELWAFFSRYVIRDRADFEAKLVTAGEVVRLRDGSGALAGFIVFEELDVEYAGKTYGVLNSLYACYDAGVRGANVTQREGLRAWIKAKLRHPLRPYYWMFTASTYKSYLLLPRNFVEYYPRPNYRWPERETSIVASVMAFAHDPGWDSLFGVIRRNGKSKYREGLVSAELNVLADRDVRFYAEMNPGQEDGDTLVCIAALSPKNIAAVIAKMIARSSRSLS
jgi:hypothetical protein